MCLYRIIYFNTRVIFYIFYYKNWKSHYLYFLFSDSLVLKPKLTLFLLFLFPFYHPYFNWCGFSLMRLACPPVTPRDTLSLLSLS